MEERNPRIAYFHSQWTLGEQISLGASDYWRFAIPAVYLYERGWDVIFGRCIASADDGTLHVQDPQGDWYADREIIVWQNWMGEGAKEAILRARAAGQVVINDLDDNYWEFPAGHAAVEGTDPIKRPDFNRDLYREIIESSSLVTVSTPYLAELVKDWGPKVELIRNYIDLDAWRPTEPGDHVGWVGSIPFRGEDLEILRETVVPWLTERGSFFYHGGNVPGARSAAEALGYARTTVRDSAPVPLYPRLWDPLKVALVPLEDTPFNRSKSWCKALEACARGIPYIASDHPEYRALPGQKRIVRVPEDWVRHLEALEDPDTYASECVANRVVADELSIANNGWRWENILRDAAKLTESPLGERPRISASARKKRLLSVDLDIEHEALLAEIPSATTMSERKMALYFASSIWDGKLDVFENGPLLGGITRALGTGMAHNERRDEGTLLQTYDWFSLRQPLDLPDDAFLQLANAGRLTLEEVNVAHEQGTFLPLFESLHRNNDYAPFLRPHYGYLPGHPGDEPEGGEAIYRAPGEREFSLLFIDGCKSWYGTHHWATETFPRAPVGSYVLFQDFGQYTCFWLPSLVGLLGDKLRPFSYVDHTYAFQVEEEITAEYVAEVFPTEPDALSREDYDRVFSGLAELAKERGDLFGTAALGAQLAAAYAYTGHEEEARTHLDGLLARYEYLPFRNYLLAARWSPTYRPDGERVML